MFAYYFELGLRSLRRNPVLTALMVMAIGFGVAASMTTYAVFRAVSGNPLPNKSNQLFVPQIDNWGPQSHGPEDEPPSMLGYIDAVALMNAHAASRQAAIYPISFPVQPADAARLPFSIGGYATYADFFSMFEVPFRYGSGWSAADDQQHADMVVISSKLNQQLFNGANSVGREIRLDDRSYRVVGVTQPWNPRPRFYDVANGNGFDAAADFYLPFSRAIELQTETNGNSSCNGHAGTGWEGMLRGQCTWISLWVELPDATAVQRYRSFLQGYAAEQQRAGRFNWAPNVRLRNLMQWLDFEHVVPQESKVSLLVALGFLVVCLVNTIGLLLAKFMRRAGEIGVRRALGASRREIYAQFLIEAGAVGLAGGVLGLLLTGIGVLGVGLVFEPDIARLAHLDLSLVGLTLLVAIGATLVAAFYPAWRAARVQPAWQLKSN
jgi:putative ABC transport system permease protein